MGQRTERSDATEMQSGDPTAPRGGTGFQGKISAFREGSPYCFIDCPEVRRQYGKDPFCPTHLLSGQTAFSPVYFDLGFGPDGRPQAVAVRDALDLLETHTPRVVAPPAKRLKTSGGDLHLGEMDVSSDGSTLTTEGTALNVESGPKGPTSSGETCEGEIVGMREGSRYCFITCAFVKESYGKDAFCPSHILPPGAANGDKIEFDLGFSKTGQPQAMEVRFLSADRGELE